MWGWYGVGDIIRGYGQGWGKKFQQTAGLAISMQLWVGLGKICNPVRALPLKTASVYRYSDYVHPFVVREV